MARFAHTPRTVSGSPRALAERRRPAVRRLSFAPDPRQLRTLLADVETSLGPGDPRLLRSVRLLVGEIVSRVLASQMGGEIHLDMEVMNESVRIDIWQQASEPCDFWDLLDDAVFSDLTSAWGRDRRRPCGAWFEVTLDRAR